MMHDLLLDWSTEGERERRFGVQRQILGPIKTAEVVPVVEVYRQSLHDPRLRVDLGRLLPPVLLLDKVVGSLNAHGIDAAQPLRDAGVTPEQLTAVEIPRVITISFIGTHAVFFNEMTNDREKLSEFLYFVHGLESRFT